VTTPDRSAGADAVFDALGDPTRRAILQQVARYGPITATEVAARLPVSRQAVGKHLVVLGQAGLVSGERDGRERRFSANSQPMIEASRWLAATGAAWDDRLTRLAARVETRARAGEAGGERQ